MYFYISFSKFLYYLSNSLSLQNSHTIARGIDNTSGDKTKKRIQNSGSSLGKFASKTKSSGSPILPTMLFGWYRLNIFHYKEISNQDCLHK